MNYKSTTLLTWLGFITTEFFYIYNLYLTNTMSNPSKKTTFSGINKYTMKKIAQCIFGDDFVSLEMDVKKHVFVIMVMEDVDQDWIDRVHKSFPQTKILSLQDRAANLNN